MAELVSPEGLEQVFAPGMDPTPPIRRRSRDLHLLVTGLEPMSVELPTWERRLIERALAEALDARTPKDARDANPQ